MKTLEAVLPMALAGWWAWRYADGKKRKARSEARLNRILGKDEGSE